MQLAIPGLEPIVRQAFLLLLNHGVGPENLKESYALKENYPDEIKFRKNGANLEVCLDGTWKRVTIT